MKTDIAPPKSWGKTTVATACPLDCPDCCSLDVTIERGQVVKIDGSRRAPSTEGYICGKVREFHRRVYHEDRVLHPLVRKGAKGTGEFERITWDEALDLAAAKMRKARDRHGAQSILPYNYGGSNGILTHEFEDARFFRRFGASRLARTLCAAPTGAAATAMYGKMAGVSYDDFEHARLIIVWGCNPSASGIHLVSHIRSAQKQGAKLVVVDPRRTPLARQADLHLAVRPGSDVAVALALINSLFASNRADLAFLDAHATGVEELRRAASEWTFDRAAAAAGVAPDAIEQFAELYAAISPAVIRCGWGQERNRNGGAATMAILALPAVAGKFGVRGGGYTMSNSGAWGIVSEQLIDVPAPATRIVNMNHLGRALLEYKTTPVNMLFVYNCNPLTTAPDQNRVLEGLKREDLFTVVFEQVYTDTARYADVVLPATTFLEHYDVVKSYGPITLQLTRPVIEPVGEARTNAHVFSELAERLGVGQAEDETETLMRISARMKDGVGAEVVERGVATPPHGGAPIQFVDVFPLTPDRKVDLFPEGIAGDAPAGLYGYQADPATERFPLALISPATEKTISSTLGELRERAAVLHIHPDDAAPRGIEQNDPIRAFNGLGELHCPANVTPDVRPGTVSFSKGVWRKNTFNGSTSNALVPDSLTDLGGGACFNDARVQVALLGRH